MKILFDETYAQEGVSSRNIWYGYMEVAKPVEYGTVLNLTKNTLTDILTTVTNDIKKVAPEPTETNWYLYCDMVTKDATDENVRPSLMIKKVGAKFTTHINMSDMEFATNLDHVTDFMNKLNEKLTQL